MSTTDSNVNAAMLRSEIALRRLKIFQVAGRVGVHPVRLGKILNERAPLPPGLGERVLKAIREERGNSVA